ncbi:hypothetical protein EV361DRAFT_128615 [Lentinula raphanica]|nr:hypothetical protein EV361DRAFT_128615 [Lentinula raphanica]
MYLFRIVFTWRLLAVYILYSTNQTVIAMPLPPKEESKGIGEFTFKVNMTTSNNAVGTTQFTPNQTIATFQSDLSSQTISDPKCEFSILITNLQRSDQAGVDLVMLKTYVLGVAIREKSHDDEKADWVAVMVPEEDVTSGKRVFGYQTLKSPNSDNEWHRRVLSGRKIGLNGASVTLSKNLRFLRIGSAKMSGDTKGRLSTDMRTEVDEHHVDRVPNVPSTYQFVILLHRQMESKYKDRVEILDFDFSESSEFGKAVKDMVEKKGTGTGEVLSGERDKWECALYERIKNGGVADTLEKSLGLKNEVILVDLRNEVDPFPGLSSNQDEWEQERAKRLALEKLFDRQGSISSHSV